LISFAVLGGLLLNVGAFLTFKGKIYEAVGVYLFADIYERDDYWGVTSILVGVILGLLAFLKMQSGKMNKSEGDVDLSKLTRLYPAAVVDMQGEIAEMSLEWMDLYGDKIKLVHFVLVFDFTPVGENVKVRTVLTFKTKDELMLEIQEVAKYLG